MATRQGIQVPLRVCLCGEDLDWLGFRCLAASIRVWLRVTLADDLEAEFFDRRILDHVWRLTVERPGDRPLVAVRGGVPLASGLGTSSAAAMAAAVLYQDQYRGAGDRRLAAAEAVAIAYEAERLVTNGGGMDHVSIASGGLVLLQGTREEKPPEIIDRIIDPDLRLVVIDSKRRKVSGSHLARLRRRAADGHPDQQRYCKTCDELAGLAWSAIQERDWRTLGEAMNSAHEAMRDLQHMSTPHLEMLREAAMAAGFLGVKITGSGGGGCLVAVAADGIVAERADRLRRATSEVAPRPSIITVGVTPSPWRP